ncbi:polyprenyl synthetase family protein [Proteinivorax tanatarense]|uniref:Polyprenyl synthetase family protein n=1 Tax=Proteinivorax tanatarense TaxID=1260629 RepID=A0AAU7VPQ9_9FIRM
MLSSLKNELNLESMLAEVELRLLDYTKSDSEKSQYLSQYLIKKGGKRLRPLLVILCAEGRNEKDVIDVAVAAELIHTASLVHDDIVDDSPKRRGVDTINSLLSNSYAVLTGDFLFAKAFEILSKFQEKKVLETFTKAITAMSIAEIEQLSNKNNLKKTYKQYYSEIYGKTGALLSACCKSGGMIAGYREREIIALETYGKELGFSFQITDDLLDVAGNGDELGKPKFQDLKEGHITLPIINLLAKDGQLDVAETLKESSNIDFSVVSKLIKEGEVDEYCYNLAVAHVDNALKSIECFGNESQRDALNKLAKLTLNRSQ